MRSTPARLLLLLLGCVVLGIGVGLLLTADLGSDGYSTLVNGLARSTDLGFFWMNLIVSAVFLLLAAVRGVVPGLGTVVQIVVVGGTVAAVIDIAGTPEAMEAQVGLMLLALPILAMGIAAYLGARLGAGPAEAAAQAWDPPLPFRWSYTALQALGATVGWLLGAAIGPGTVAVVVLLGTLVDVAAHLLRVDLAGTRAGETHEPATPHGATGS